MELTLKIPQRLVFRLRPHESQLDKILELGLDAFEAADRIAGPTEEGAFLEQDIPDSWRQAAGTLSESLASAPALPAPSRAELVAYLEGDLEEANAESLRQRLLEHPKALEDLLVMEDPHLGSVSLEEGDDAGAGDLEVRQAWEQMQVRLAARQRPEPDLETGADSSTAKADSRTPLQVSQARRFAKTSRLRPWLSLAAGVLLTTLSFTASSVYHGRQAGAPQITQDIELNVSRGGRLFEVQEKVDQVMLRISRPATTLGQGPRTLEVVSPTGKTILKRHIEGWDQGGNSLHVVLPRHQLAAGDYLLLIRDPAPGATEPPQQYRFALEML